MDASESVSDKPVYDPLADDIDQAERLDQCLGLLATVVENSAFCRSRIAFCNRMDAAAAGCSFCLRVNSRLWPDPIDSKTDTLTFYTSECICRRIRHEEDG
jgi:hypothetical protein